jgi:hypothetical protein
LTHQSKQVTEDIN